MDQFFRIALCVCLCLGSLHATPLRSARTEPLCEIIVEDVGFDLLNDVSCKNFTLYSPVDTKPDCYHSSLVHYREQLALVHANCANSKYTLSTSEALDSCTGLRPADCNLTLSAHDTFEGFKSALKTFVEKFNVHQLTSK